MNFKGFGSDLGGSDNGGGGRPPAPGNYLARQSSVYSLTFDEFMTTMGGSGKDFGSMNMDELLKNIWTAEEVQTTGAATAVQPGTGTLGGGGGGGGGFSHLQKQGSLTLPRTISQKTVDEVWKDISKDYGGSIGSRVPKLAQAERQPTLGEITLEEFLVRAGVVREDAQQFSAKQNDAVFGGLGMGMGYHQQFNKVNGLMGNNSNRIDGVGGEGVNNNDPNSMVVSLQSPSTNLPLSVNGVRSSNQQQQQMQQNSHSQQQQQQHQQIFPKSYATQMPLANNQVMRGGIVGLSADQGMNGGGNLVQGMVGLQPGPVHVPTGSPANSDKIGKSNGDTSSVSPVPYVFNVGLRGRKSGGAVEKVIERRQRRMIKNRESAARSRARKQAYTMELEAEVAKLKEENQELQKKQAEIMEIQKNQVMEMMNLQREVKRRCLRRTLTGPW